MSTLKKIVLALVGLVVLLAGIGLLLPRQVHVERSIVINAPRATVFALAAEECPGVTGTWDVRTHQPTFASDVPNAAQTGRDAVIPDCASICPGGLTEVG